jgi:hypothetical protein
VAKVSEHKVQQILNVQRDVPELLRKVASGEMKLADAVKQTPLKRLADAATMQRAAKQAAPPKADTTKSFDLNGAVKRDSEALFEFLRRRAEKVPESYREGWAERLLFRVRWICGCFVVEEEKANRAPSIRAGAAEGAEAPGASL